MSTCIDTLGFQATFAAAHALTTPRMPTAPSANPSIRVVIVTMDTHLNSAAIKARSALLRPLPGLAFSIHSASAFTADANQLARCKADIAQADIVIVTMLFMEDHFLPILDDLRAQRDRCDAMVCIMSAPEVMRLVRMGRYVGSEESTGLLALLKRFKPNSSNNLSLSKSTSTP